MKLERRSFIKSAALLAACGVPEVGLIGESAADTEYSDDSTLLTVGLKKQLFLDDILIESVQDIAREFHAPKKVPQNPLIKKDKPWEHVLLVRTASYRVLHHPKDNRFKAWYSDEGWTQQLVESNVTWPLYRDHYAYSEDGIHWIKPKLGIYVENGEDTNIFRGDQKTGSAEVFDLIIDPFESDESKRYKGIHLWAAVDQRGQGNYEAGHFVISYSADGIHWTPYDRLPTFGKLGSHLDDVVVLNCDVDKRTYLLNTRNPIDL